MVGETLGPYLVLAKLGEGGMGEVYRARDTKLKREVAIKVLLSDVAGDPERIARFEREAIALAALHHPHIASLFGMEEAAGQHYLVMELVEGQTLAERLAASAMPIDDAIGIARQIAEALEAAHERGIVHRDLKPANIKITPEGTVKVLDFGLAKAGSTGSAGSEGSAGSLANSPTITTPAMTVHGMILGTAAYMSPEQASGKAVDKRSDIWSFGVVLWEMVMGKRLFEGETLSHTLADVLRAPIEFTALPAETPPRVRELVKRCLERDVKKRLRDIGEARIALDRAKESPTDDGGASGIGIRSRVGWTWWALASSLALLTAIAGLASWRISTTSPPPATRTLRYEIPSPADLPIREGKLSPDGSQIALAIGAGPSRQLWLRSLDSLESHRLDGTDGANGPFWSADSRSVAFYNTPQRRILQLSRTGGRPTLLCETSGSSADAFGGGAWRADGVIVYSLGGAFFRCTSGGPSIKLADSLRGVAPELLPDGRFLFNGLEEGISVGSLDGSPPVRLLPDNSSVAYVSTAAEAGRLVFKRGDTLLAQLFDLRRTAVQGDAMRVADHIGDSSRGNLGFTFSIAGDVLAYTQGLGSGRLVSWIAPDGRRLKNVFDKPLAIALPNYFSLSPDEKYLAVTLGVETERRELWLLDLGRGGMSRFAEVERAALWSADSKALLYARDGQWFRKPADGSGAEEPVFKPRSATALPNDWSRDGKLIAYTERDQESSNVWLLPMTAPDSVPRRLSASRINETFPTFSPDGRWVAYYTGGVGSVEVWVRSVEPGGKARQISINGGSFPQWSHDGSELFYREGSKTVAVRMQLSASDFQASAPRTLFDNVGIDQFRVARDGRFLMVLPSDGGDIVRPMTVVTNWLRATPQ